jgi:2-dehydro-3-deoxyphosphogluconate aldolase / (4S)-4-hydroxy-2-oxoglutarate aldolase
MEKVKVCGAMTPAEILTAWNAGADMMKVFQVAQPGGPEYIRAIRVPGKRGDPARGRRE